jgi:predicted N-formylglutamate amidohydrolase
VSIRIDAVVVTCEHGGRRVPAEWTDLFRGGGAVRALESHRGWDPGALGMARRIARRLGAPLRVAIVTRLLVELNRSPHHRSLFSRFVRAQPPDVKERILARHYRPYRRDVEREVTAALRGGRRVLHLSVHTFTPVLDGVTRSVDVGLLYDPARPAERALCRRWARELRAGLPGLRVRKNRPYRGAADGLTTHLRRRLGPRYLGIELETSQRFFAADGRPRDPRVRGIEESVARLLGRERRRT